MVKKIWIDINIHNNILHCMNTQLSNPKAVTFYKCRDLKKQWSNRKNCRFHCVSRSASQDINIMTDKLIKQTTSNSFWNNFITFFFLNKYNAIILEKKDE